MLEKEMMNFLQYQYMTTVTNTNFHKGHGKKLTHYYF